MSTTNNNNNDTKFGNDFAPRILVVEDQTSMQRVLKEYFTKRGFDITGFQSADEVIRTYGASENFELNEIPSSQLRLHRLLDDFDAVLTDVKMPGVDGLTFCDILHQQIPELPVVVMTAYGSMETAVEALRSGAFDFVTKPVEMEVLHAALKRATKLRLVQRQVLELSERARHQEFAELIGESEPMQTLKSQLAQFATSDASVLLTGESGVGKEVVASVLHQKSSRSKKPFVAVNCAALSKSLVESELFGHVKGAFTDARQDRTGLFVEADGGTLFLDEIGEMPIDIQPKLLRALEERVVRPVGGGSDSKCHFDVRLITATNRDLQEEIESKRFREDLFYRINVLEIQIPPLRVRGTDAILIAKIFVQELAEKEGRDPPEISANAVQKMMAYNWPGNVRELRNVVQRAMVLTQPGKKIELAQLPDKIVEFKATTMVLGDQNYQPLGSLDDIERRYIQFVLEQTNGNRGEAARILGIDRKTLYRKLKAQEDGSSKES